MLIDKKKLIVASISGLMLLNISMISAETLEQAWGLAIAHNHLLKSAKAVTNASEHQLYSAQGQRLPELNIGGGYSQNDKLSIIRTQINGQGPDLDLNVAQRGRANAQAMLSVPVFTSGRISRNIDAAEASLQAMQNNELATVLDIKMRVAEAYIAVLRAESSVQVAQSHVDSLTAHNQDVSNLFTQKIVARNDLLSANVELANAKQRVVQALNQLDAFRSLYNQLLDRPLSTKVELISIFPAIPEGVLAELSQQAGINRPELDMLSRQIESLKQQAKSVKAEILPQISVDGGFRYQENRYQVNPGMWLASVNMEWRLFDGTTRHKSNAVNRQAIALKDEFNDLRSQIDMQVRRAWMDIEETRNRIKVAKVAIEQAEENMKVTTRRYQQGFSTQTDVLRAEDLRTITHDNYNNARYDRDLAILRLRRAIGIL
jgi:outer membrane protein